MPKTDMSYKEQKRAFRYLMFLAFQDTTGVEIQNQRLRPLHHKQNHKQQQCTIIWHVDDLKISHVEKNVVQDMLKQFIKIWTRQSIHYQQRKSTRLLGNDD